MIAIVIVRIVISLRQQLNTLCFDDLCVFDWSLQASRHCNASTACHDSFAGKNGVLCQVVQKHFSKHYIFIIASLSGRSCVYVGGQPLVPPLSFVLALDV
eukprot:1030354-Amphidinium_carterae.1